MQRKFLAAAGAALLAVVIVGAPLCAQIKKGKTRVLTTKSWMKSVNGPVCSSLKKVLDGSGPADDKAWASAAQYAELLNESGHVLMADGRCPDAVWAGAAKQLRESSAAVLAAVEVKNATEAKTAFAGVLGACGTCHTAHKKKK